MFDLSLTSLDFSKITELGLAESQVLQSQSKEQEKTKHGLIIYLLSQKYCNKENQAQLLKWLDDLITLMGPLEKSVLLEFKKTEFETKTGFKDITVFEVIRFILCNNPFDASYADNLAIFKTALNNCSDQQRFGQEQFTYGLLGEKRFELACKTFPEIGKVIKIEKNSRDDDLGIDALIKSEAGDLLPFQIKARKKRKSKKHKPFTRKDILLNHEEVGYVNARESYNAAISKEIPTTQKNTGNYILRVKNFIPEIKLEGISIQDITGRTKKIIKSYLACNKLLSSAFLNFNRAAKIIDLFAHGFYEPREKNE